MFNDHWPTFCGYYLIVQFLNIQVHTLIHYRHITQATMSTDVVVDALPYIDHGYEDPGVREAALAMVEDETRRYRPTKAGYHL